VGLEELAERLSAMAEELGELAYNRLHEASSALSSGSEPDARLLAEERRITRARRAVEKAVALLGGGRDSGSDSGDSDSGSGSDES
jgi:hypothetical protein